MVEYNSNNGGIFFNYDYIDICDKINYNINRPVAIIKHKLKRGTFMKFNFGEKMKNLRKKRDLTQEQLAEHLGVSFQAVSKWETNAAYPDISLFPVIANFYGVTTDELLGVDITKANEKQEEYLKSTWDLSQQWKLVEMVELARKACLEFPGNLRMLENLSWCLQQSSGMMSKENLDEAIDIAKKILAESTDTMQRHRATVRMCYCYDLKGDKEKALEYANQLPSLAQTREFLSGRLNLHKGKQQIEYSQSCILLYVRALMEVMIEYADVEYANSENTLSHAEKITLLQNILTIHKTIYGDKLCDQNFDAYTLNMDIADVYLRMDDKNNALDYIEKAYACAEEFRKYDDGDNYQSLLLKNIESLPHSHWSRSAFEDMLDRLGNKNYEAIRNDPQFVAILEKIK